MKALILGSERGVRRLDSAKSYPSALVEDWQGQRVLDWILAALEKERISDVAFVGGYHIEKVVGLYPRLRFFYNERWQEGRDLDALLAAAPALADECLLVVSNVVFRFELIAKLRETKGDIVLGVRGPGTQPLQEPYDEFAGVLLLRTHGSEQLREFLQDGAGASGRDERHLVALLQDLDCQIACFDVDNACATVDSPRALSRFIFGTKAQTLERLQPLVTRSTILSQVRFTVAEWEANADEVLIRIREELSSTQVVVRSSALSEDCWSASQAGRFRSVLGVPCDDQHALREAVEEVIQSFAASKSVDEANEVFVQPHLENVSVSGVLFSRDPDSGAPYMVLTYDESTRLTDTVTSGRGTDLRTAIVYKYAETDKVQHPRIRRLMDVVAELEELSGHDSLDVEFAFDDDDTCYVLQVRVIAERESVFELADQDVREELATLREYIAELMGRRSHLAGETTILANMPDWNPAEIVGITPRPLAWSLYQHIITDRVWGQARAATHYRDTYPEPLIISLAGHPYVDTRASLNSFTPEALSTELTERVVSHCLDWLCAHPHFHDKFEFEVALTCMDFDFDRHEKRMLENGFSGGEVGEIRKALLDVTNTIVTGRVEPIDSLMGRIGQLEARRDKALAERRPSLLSLMRTVDFLLDDCMRFGTLPFSILARYAYISTSFLKSLRARGVFSPEDIDRITQGVPTVATEISGDFNALTSGAMEPGSFLEKYGHLRPGTYDITSLSYAEDPEFYLAGRNQKPGMEVPAHEVGDPAEQFLAKAADINALLGEAGFAFDAEQLQKFILTSIPMREKAKFEFTKNLSVALALLVEFGERLDLSRDDLSFVPIKRMLELSTNSPSTILKKEIANLAGLNRKRYALHSAIRLPHMITCPEDIDSFDLLEWHPNYITSGRVTGALADIDHIDHTVDLTRQIALIESADPGYDWIFTRGICGLITKYGGAASHMAIRAAELSLPAAIGCGEVIYDRVAKGQVVELNCAEQRIRVIR